MKYLIQKFFNKGEKGMDKNEIIKVKKELVDLLRKNIEYNLLTNEKQLKRTRRDVIEAPGRMQSRYDSARQEYGYLADSLQKRVDQIRRDLSILDNYQFKKESSNSGEVCVDSIVRTASENDNEKTYFLFLVGGGTILKSSLLKNEVTVVTHVSPLGKGLLGKTVGDSIKVASEKQEIAEIL